MKHTLIIFISFLTLQTAFCQSFLIEAESFDEKGGWLVDPQFVQQMGSPYLLAHGLGVPVENAGMEVKFPEQGTYHIWVRTKNWVPGNWDAPGRFQLKVDDQVLEKEFGTTPEWSWEYGGDIQVSNLEKHLELIDLTGFEGRCDAIYFSMENAAPPVRGEALAEWRNEVTNQKNDPEITTA